MQVHRILQPLHAQERQQQQRNDERGGHDHVDRVLGAAPLQIRAHTEPRLDVAHLVEAKVWYARLLGTPRGRQVGEQLRVQEALLERALRHGEQEKHQKGKHEPQQKAEHEHEPLPGGFAEREPQDGEQREGRLLEQDDGHVEKVHLGRVGGIDGRLAQPAEGGHEREEHAEDDADVDVVAGFRHGLDPLDDGGRDVQHGHFGLLCLARLPDGAADAIVRTAGRVKDQGRDVLELVVVVGVFVLRVGMVQLRAVAAFFACTGKGKVC